MQITLTVDSGGAQHQIQAIINSLDDLKMPLAVFNKYYRKKVQQRFDEGGPGWAPTKRATIARKPGEDAVKQLADELVRRKLRRELRRAKQRAEKIHGPSTAAAVARRYAVLKEFERLAAGGSPELSVTGDAKLDKSVRGLRERHQRATATAAKRPLGRIASSIKSKLTKYELTIESTIEWAGAHNKGAEVGKGAKLPKREFLPEPDEQDLKMLAELIEDFTRFNV